jgi:hypothetical protein
VRRIFTAFEKRQKREKSEEVKKLNQNSQQKGSGEHQIELPGNSIHTPQMYTLT